VAGALTSLACSANSSFCRAISKKQADTNTRETRPARPYRTAEAHLTWQFYGSGHDVSWPLTRPKLTPSRRWKVSAGCGAGCARRHVSSFLRSVVPPHLVSGAAPPPETGDRGGPARGVFDMHVVWIGACRWSPTVANLAWAVEQRARSPHSLVSLQCFVRTPARCCHLPWRSSRGNLFAYEAAGRRGCGEEGLRAEPGNLTGDSWAGMSTFSRPPGAPLQFHLAALQSNRARELRV
jgi:hypothetical protein